jgi:hypothetical protein
MESQSEAGSEKQISGQGVTEESQETETIDSTSSKESVIYTVSEASTYNSLPYSRDTRVEENSLSTIRREE